jgi:prevent-host-death family protein
MTLSPRDDLHIETIGVADVKRRFSELIDRARAGKRFVVARRGKPAMVLVPPTPGAMRPSVGDPIGLAAVAGALADWDELDEVVTEIYAARRHHGSDRPVPELS